MTQLPKETQNGDTNKSKGKNGHAKHKPKYAKYAQKNTLSPTGLYELVLVDVHMENFQCTA